MRVIVENTKFRGQYRFLTATAVQTQLRRFQSSSQSKAPHGISLRWFLVFVLFAKLVSSAVDIKLYVKLGENSLSRNTITQKSTKKIHVHTIHLTNCPLSLFCLAVDINRCRYILLHLVHNYRLEGALTSHTPRFELVLRTAQNYWHWKSRNQKWILASIWSRDSLNNNFIPQSISFSGPFSTVTLAW